MHAPNNCARLLGCPPSASHTRPSRCHTSSSGFLPSCAPVACFRRNGGWLVVGRRLATVATHRVVLLRRLPRGAAAMPARAAPAETGAAAQRRKSKSKQRRRRQGSGAAAPLRPLASWRPLTSIREARKVTAKFHEYTAELEALRSGKDGEGDGTGPMSKNQRSARAAELEQLIQAVGGRKRYQEASILLTGQNSSSAKWVFRNVTELGLRPKSGEPRLRTLEIGAINTQILSCHFLDVRAIDLTSRFPKVEELDFFDLPCPGAGPFRVISNAMVVNCVPTPPQRGEMLVRCARLLESGGLLSLVLPKRCVAAVSEERLRQQLQLLGFEIRATNESPKIAFFACTKERRCWHQVPSAAGQVLSSEELCAKLNGSRPPPPDVHFAVTFEMGPLDTFCNCRSAN
mmetsp:Transcript_22359/g.63588  ORF Transcript_22359/g.63588 Transcript_22359/m.63588 type:complete len:402 (-) Transcript_22359:33-1238(-)